MIWTGNSCTGSYTGWKSHVPIHILVLSPPVLCTSTLPTSMTVILQEMFDDGFRTCLASISTIPWRRAFRILIKFKTIKKAMFCGHETRLHLQESPSKWMSSDCFRSQPLPNEVSLHLTLLCSEQSKRLLLQLSRSLIFNFSPCS